MAESYKQFLQSPSADLLAENAGLHYVATTTSFTGVESILTHLGNLRKQVSKKKQDILNTIESSGSAVFEVSTALEFHTSGGVYLPGLDDNFVSDRVVYLSMIHIVSFDSAGKIAQIRQYWDQGALLKQLEVIGKTGRNWPIRDSREQLKLVESSLKNDGKLASEVVGHNEAIVHARNKSGNILRDPHASLQLFGDREELAAADALETPVPLPGNRPQHRDLAEIVGDNPKDQTTDAPFHRPVSPTKTGQGKNHPKMRLFEGAESADLADEPAVKVERLMRPHPGKYNHFEFADGSDPQDAPVRGIDHDKRVKNKHDSQWSFDDFVTPQRPLSIRPARGEHLRGWEDQPEEKPTQPTHPRGARSQDERHWDPEHLDDGPKEEPSGRARRDAETHFELQDDGERQPNQEKVGRAPGTGHNEGLGLYKNQIFDKVEPVVGPNRALGNITNLKDRGKDFDPHFSMSDNSPSGPKSTQNVTENRQKAVKMMDHNWEVYEQSPLKENQPRDPTVADRKGIHIAGDGMGGKKGTERNWLYGNDDESVKPVPRSNAQPSGGKRSFWDF